MHISEIQSLAAQMTEADIAALIRAKAGDKVEGHEVQSVFFNSFRFENKGRIEPVESVAIKANDVWGHGDNFAGAIKQLSNQLTNPSQSAAELRAYAQRLLADAEKLAS